MPPYAAGTGITSRTASGFSLCHEGGSWVLFPPNTQVRECKNDRGNPFREKNIAPQIISIKKLTLQR